MLTDLQKGLWPLQRVSCCCQASQLSETGWKREPVPYQSQSKVLGQEHRQIAKSIQLNIIMHTLRHRVEQCTQRRPCKQMSQRYAEQSIYIKGCLGSALVTNASGLCHALTSKTAIGLR